MQGARDLARLSFGFTGVTRRLAGALVIGAVGTLLLLALGVWQLQRLEWKRGLLAEIEERIAAEPRPLPAEPDPKADRFLPVELTGTIGPESLRVVWTDGGRPAFRIISPFETDGRTVLLDRGVVPAEAPVPPAPTGRVTVAGNLHWPDEADRFTPAPDAAAGLWYARDLAAMATALGAEPLLVVARVVPGDSVAPRPVTTAGIRNGHLEYAVTWFSLAAIWAGMTALLVWRITRRIG